MPTKPTKLSSSFARVLSVSALAAIWTMTAPAMAQLANPDFSGGLDGWTVAESGGTDAPGTVAIDNGWAVLTEGDSFSVSLSQSFVAPAGLTTLSCGIDPSIDETGGPIPDAIEVSVEDTDGYSVVPAWQPGASTLYNLPEGGAAARLGQGTVYEASTGMLSTDLSAVPAGDTLVVRFSLVGADDDTGSVLRVSGCSVGVGNVPPVADAGADRTVECGAGGLTLDGSGSSDGDGDALSYAWTDASGNQVGDEATAELDAVVGTETYTLTVTDPSGASDDASVTITVTDTAGPEFSSALGPAIADADETCSGVIPDLSDLASDACGDVTVTQSPPAGTPFTRDATSVTVTATDEANNTSEATIWATVVDVTDPVLAPLTPVTVTVDADCAGVIPELEATATDNCATLSSGLTISQAPPAGSPLTLGQEIQLTARATDAAGNSVVERTTVTLVDPDGRCEPPVTTPPNSDDEDLVAKGGAGCSCESGGVPMGPLALAGALAAWAVIRRWRLRPSD